MDLGIDNEIGTEELESEDVCCQAENRIHWKAL
jgi:hypothetical protein